MYKAITHSINHQIPVRTFADWDEKGPGFFEGDLVAHCGGRVDGTSIPCLLFTVSRIVIINFLYQGNHTKVKFNIYGRETRHALSLHFMLSFCSQGSLAL